MPTQYFQFHRETWWRASRRRVCPRRSGAGPVETENGELSNLIDRITDKYPFLVSIGHCRREMVVLGMEAVGSGHNGSPSEKASVRNSGDFNGNRRVS